MLGLQLGNKKWVFITAALIIIIAVLVTIFLYNQLIGAISAGIASSILATLIFWLLTDVLQKNSERMFLSSAVERLENLEKSKTDGVINIIKREYDSNEFWINFLNDADKKITISGRTLNRWINSKEREDTLKKVIIKIVKEEVNNIESFDEPVRLVIYSDDGIKDEIERIGGNNVSKNTMSKDFLNEKMKIKNYVYNIWSKLNSKQKNRIAVYEVPILPYLYCNNGKHCIAGPYFNNRNNKNNMLIVFSGGEYEREYTEDFLGILKKIHPTNLALWAPQTIKEGANL